MWLNEFLDWQEFPSAYKLTTKFRISHEFMQSERNMDILSREIVDVISKKIDSIILGDLNEQQERNST